MWGDKMDIQDAIQILEVRKKIQDFYLEKNVGAVIKYGVEIERRLLIQERDATELAIMKLKEEV
jgi:hypothetical protein